MKDEWIVMEERRKAERLEEENEVSINISSEDTLIPVEEWSKLPEPNEKDENSSKEKIPYNRSKNISMSGANIQGNILLPVDTIIKIDITLSNLQQKITTIGNGTKSSLRISLLRLVWNSSIHPTKRSRNFMS